MSAFTSVTPLAGVANDLLLSSSLSSIPGTKTSLPSTTTSSSISSTSSFSLLEPRTPFPHPYTPYSIQSQLMSRIYTTVKRKNIGIYESPTGTVCKYTTKFCSSR